MQHLFNLTLGLFFFFFGAAGLEAQVSQCGGTWTNKACAVEGSPVLEKRPVKERTQAERDLDKKKLWIHDLEMQALKAKRVTGVEVKSAPARDLCLKPDTSLLECLEAISRFQEMIIELLAKKSNVTEATQGKNQPSSSQQTTIEQNNTVVIVDNSSHIKLCDPLYDRGCEPPLETVAPGGHAPGAGPNMKLHKPSAISSPRQKRERSAPWGGVSGISQ